MTSYLNTRFSTKNVWGKASRLVMGENTGFGLPRPSHVTWTCPSLKWHCAFSFVSVFAATTLSGMHFVVTGIVGAISSALGYSSAKVAVPFLELVWFTILANMSVVGMNSSLMLNSVGFYQVSWIMIG